MIDLAFNNRGGDMYLSLTADLRLAYKGLISSDIFVSGN